MRTRLILPIFLLSAAALLSACGGGRGVGHIAAGVRRFGLQLGQAG